METDDITLHLLIAKFVKALSSNQRVEFALIMDILNDQYQSNSKSTNESMTKHTAIKKTSLNNFIPTSDTEPRNMYIVGKRSIAKNLPRPKVQLIDRHFYVSICQCIANFLASGKMLHKINNSKKMVCVV